MPGTVTSSVEVVQLTPFGLWLAWGEKEYFLEHDLYPWFREARVNEIFSVEEVGENHLFWPELDVDLDRDRIENPEKYPLIAGSVARSKAP